VSADLAIVDRTKHVDGMVEVAAPMSCSACHGSTTSAAPPPDLAGNTETTEPGVGAHQQHFTTSIARPVLCSECHLVPESVFDPAHMDTAGPAEVVFSGVATEFGAAPTYNGNTCANTYCHGAMFVRNSPSDGTHTAPIWTQVDGTQTGCRGCHGLPPAAPHPAISSPCSSCHPNIGDDLSFIDPLKHVNGRIDLDIRL
jgi:predicted CxxxxCH...CXXCH cytochrome family protein